MVMDDRRVLCKWSSDNYRCDLLVHTCGDDGWLTHVHNTRYAGPIPAVDDDAVAVEWVEQSNRRMEALTGTERVRIHGFCDGASFHDATTEALAARLVMLQSGGYRFPDWLLDAVGDSL
jgi:hypothetical protein